MTGRTIAEVKGEQRPFYDAHVFCCVNMRVKGHPRGCCQEKGAIVLRNYMKDRAKELGIKRTRINASQCLDRCELGPVMVIYPEGIWYGYRTKADLDEILQSHLIEGRVVERLLLDPDQVPEAPAEGEARTAGAKG